MRLHLNITQNIYFDRKTKYIIELASITVVNTGRPHKKKKKKKKTRTGRVIIIIIF